MPGTPRTRAPSAADIAAAMAVLTPHITPPAPPPPPPADNSVVKLVVGGVVALIGIIMAALFIWVGSSVQDLSRSVTLMSANVDNLQKSITELQQGQGANSKSTSDLQAQVAAGAARSTAIEQDMNRVKERVRILEGQRPLNTGT